MSGDGRGADERKGSGLQGLKDRVGALDGTLSVLSPPGQGTGAIHLTTAGGTGWRLIAGVDQPSALVGWSPDGRRIAYTNQLGGVEVVTSAGRKLQEGLWSVGKPLT